MNNRLILLSGIFFLMTAVFTLSSCSKTDEENLNKTQQSNTSENSAEVTVIDEKDLSESNEDMTTVDYRIFYDQLSPYGEWLEVRPEEIGLQANTARSGIYDSDFLSFSEIIGVKKANAAVEDAEMVFVWKPSPELGITIVKEETPEFKPYINGQWIYTDEGWYFKAPTPAEETVSHFGRWVNTPSAGWLWVPGRVWSPAWVDWRQDEKYLSWAPLPPSVYVVNNTVKVPVIEERNYVIVEKKYFLEPQVYKYITVNSSIYPVREMTRIDNITVAGDKIISKGPAVNIFEALLGYVINPVKIVAVKNINEVRYTDREYVVYKPVFRKYKNKGNIRVSIKEPKSYKKYEEWKVLKSEEKELKRQEKESRKEDKESKKEIRKDEKEIRKGIWENDNGNKKSDYEGRKENQGSEKTKKNNDRENGNKNKNNNNENKNKNNHDGKEKK
ncbi:MAG: hypothetical protein JST15_00025 [Bacteroidetes bacterium]|nr:hypothetical protein [Bacteroidota bacterium]